MGWLGDAEVERKSLSDSQTTTKSWSVQRMSVIDPQFVRKLGKDEALAIMSLRGHAFDDVLKLRPVYV